MGGAAGEGASLRPGREGATAGRGVRPKRARIEAGGRRPVAAIRAAASIALVALVAWLAGRGVPAAIGGERAADIVRFAEPPLIVAPHIALVAIGRDKLAFGHEDAPFARPNEQAWRTIHAGIRASPDA